jgi:hypothetical protein
MVLGRCRGRHLEPPSRLQYSGVAVGVRPYRGVYRTLGVILCQTTPPELFPALVRCVCSAHCSAHDRHGG